MSEGTDSFEFNRQTVEQWIVLRINWLGTIETIDRSSASCQNTIGKGDQYLLLCFFSAGCPMCDRYEQQYPSTSGIEPWENAIGLQEPSIATKPNFSEEEEASVGSRRHQLRHFRWPILRGFQETGDE
jgi:hypothetical protein